MPDPVIRHRTRHVANTLFNSVGVRSPAAWDFFSVPRTAPPRLPAWVLHMATFDGVPGEFHYDTEVYRVAAGMGVTPLEIGGLPCAIDVLEEPGTPEEIREVAEWADDHFGELPELEHAVIAAINAGLRLIVLPDMMGSDNHRFYRLAEDFPDLHSPHPRHCAPMVSSLHTGVVVGDGLSGTIGTGTGTSLGATTPNTSHRDHTSVAPPIDSELPMQFKCTSRGDSDGRAVWVLACPDLPALGRFWTDSLEDARQHPNTVYIPELAGMFDADAAWKVICTHCDARLPGEELRAATQAVNLLARNEHVDV